jgi:hypothetical protein
MNLTTTLFDIRNLRKKHKLISFVENGITINVLSPINSEINTGHRYMFGTYKDNKFYWFFNGKSIANSRQMMRDLFLEISENIDDKNQIIFIYKGNLYGSRI